MILLWGNTEFLNDLLLENFPSVNSFLWIDFNVCLSFDKKMFNSFADSGCYFLFTVSYQRQQSEVNQILMETFVKENQHQCENHFKLIFPRRDNRKTAYTAVSILN